jgi:hypothetical protein
MCGKEGDSELFAGSGSLEKVREEESRAGDGGKRKREKDWEARTRNTGPIETCNLTETMHVSSDQRILIHVTA